MQRALFEAASFTQCFRMISSLIWSRKSETFRKPQFSLSLTFSYHYQIFLKIPFSKGRLGRGNTIS